MFTMEKIQIWSKTQFWIQISNIDIIQKLIEVQIFFFIMYLF